MGGIRVQSFGCSYRSVHAFLCRIRQGIDVNADLHPKAQSHFKADDRVGTQRPHFANRSHGAVYRSISSRARVVNFSAHLIESFALRLEAMMTP